MGKIVKGVLFWTVQDIADALGVLPVKIRRLEDMGEISSPTERIGRRFYYNPESAASIIERFSDLKNRDARSFWRERRGE